MSFVTMAGRGVLVVAVIAGLGLAGAAIQLIPTYELGEASSRGGGLSYVQAAASGLMPVDLLTLLLPYGFRADPAVQWMRYPYWESTVYVGVVGLLLTGVGLVFGARRIVLPLVGLGLAGLLLAMAANAPLDVYGWLWMLPGFSSMRAPVRYTLIVELVLALLAAIGVDRLRADSAPRGVRWYALLTVTGVVGIVAGGVMLRDWLIADEAGSLRAIQQAYLTLPRDRAALSAAAVRSGLLGTLLLVNPWTALALGSGVGVSIMLAVWAWRRRGSAALAAMVAVLGAAELLLVAHSFHPTTTRAELHRASRPMRFLSAQPGYWRTLLAGRSDLSVTSRPALFGVAQAYGYSSLPTTRMERYWTRVNEIDDDLLDLWNVRYLVQAKGSEPRTQAFGVTFDPARPLIDGPAGSPLGDERFRIVPTQADTVRVLGSLTRGERLANGETIAEVVVSGPAGAPVTLAVQAGRDISEAAYDESASRIAHRKATVGLRWEPHDPSGQVYPRDIYVADLRLPSSMLIEHLDVRTTARTGNLRLVGIGLYDYAPSTVLSVLPANRSKYALVYEGDNALVYENHQAQPRAYLAARAVSIPSDDWSITHLTDDARDPRQTVLLEQPSATSASVLMDGAPVRATESAEIERYESDRVVVRVRAEEARYLVLADSYFPGWSAWIDGRPVEVERANYLFRALEVPAGEHLVEWRYQPASLLHGAAISAGALIIMLVLAVCGLASRRRSHATLA